MGSYQARGVNVKMAPLVTTVVERRHRARLVHDERLEFLATFGHMTHPHSVHHDVVVIGASAGGVEALSHLLSKLPADLPACLLVVLHRPVQGLSHLVQILARATKLSVVLAKSGDPLTHGVCYLADPTQHLTLGVGGLVRILPNGFYRTHNIDALFCSTALNVGARAIGVVLSGMWKDGAFGLQLIKDAGGATLVQSPSDSICADMPSSAIEQAGSIDFVGSSDALAAKICELVAPQPCSESAG